jgi:bisphosphoglycerate-dependent phosphoglycerate mutase
MSDTPLTEDGVKEAEIAGKLLKMHRMDFDVVHTSLLRRCIHTSWVVLQQLGIDIILIADGKFTWQLYLIFRYALCMNERSRMDKREERLASE